MQRAGVTVTDVLPDFGKGLPVGLAVRGVAENRTTMRPATGPAYAEAARMIGLGVRRLDVAPLASYWLNSGSGK